MDQMVTTYKYRMEPSRKNVVWVGGRQLCDLRRIRPSKACGRSSWFSGNHSPSQGGRGAPARHAAYGIDTLARLPITTPTAVWPHLAGAHGHELPLPLASPLWPHLAGAHGDELPLADDARVASWRRRRRRHTCVRARMTIT